MDGERWFACRVCAALRRDSVQWLCPLRASPPGCYAATMSLIGPSGDAAATLVFFGGLTRCESSPCFQPLWMRLPAATLAAVVIDDGMTDFAAIEGDTQCSGFAPCGRGPPGCSAARMILIGPSGDTVTLVPTGGLACCESSPCFQLWMCLSSSMLDEVKESSSFTSSCKKETNSFLRVKSCEDTFPMFESSCSFWTAGLAALCGLCWNELSLEHSMAIAGIFLSVGASAIESDDNKFNSSSCIEANDLHGSSGNEASTSGDKSEKKEEIQFFVNYGKGSVVVRCSPHSIVSHVLHYGCEEYAVCGTRTLRSDDTLHQNGIESGMTVRVLCRLRGGSGGNMNVDIPGQWQCNFCHATRCWPTRKRCYRCDTPRDFSIPNSPVRGPLGRAPQPTRNNVPPTRSSGPGPQTVPPRNFGNVPPPQRPPPGAGVGPISADVGKRDEGSDLVQALSLLQKIMTPEDFVKYQLLISPKQKQNKKTREQELADKVKSQEKLRSQEASHKGQIDKLELDLQRHRDMLQGVLERIRLVDDEIKDLRVQVAKEKSDSSDGDNASVRTAPATQVDSQPDIGLVVDPTAPTPLHPGPFESCDEDMLYGASEAEDEGEVRRNGIWERRRVGVIKKGKLLKYKEKAKAKQNKSIIVEEGEGPPPDPPAPLAEVLTSLTQEGLLKKFYPIARLPYCKQ